MTVQIMSTSTITPDDHRAIENPCQSDRRDFEVVVAPAPRQRSGTVHPASASAARGRKAIRRTRAQRGCPFRRLPGGSGRGFHGETFTQKMTRQPLVNAREGWREVLRRPVARTARRWSRVRPSERRRATWSRWRARPRYENTCWRTACTPSSPGAASQANSARCPASRDETPSESSGASSSARGRPVTWVRPRVPLTRARSGDRSRAKVGGVCRPTSRRRVARCCAR